MRFVFPIGLSLLVGCSSISKLTTTPKAQVVFEQDGVVSTSNSPLPETVRSGDSRELAESTPLLFESRGYLPILVLPPQPGAEKISLRLKTLGSDDSLSQEMERVLGGILRVQKLLRDRKGREALTVADDLLTRYPRVPQIRRMKAACLLVLGEKKAADSVLNAKEPEPETETKTEPELAEPVQGTLPAVEEVKQ